MAVAYVSDICTEGEANQQSVFKSLVLADVGLVVEYPLVQYSSHLHVHSLSLAHDLRRADFESCVTSNEWIFELEE